jgi:PAS domain S-box-containing protein
MMPPVDRSESPNVLSVLRVCQELSSATSLGQIKSRVEDALPVLTGATRVLLIFQDAALQAGSAMEDFSAQRNLEHAGNQDVFPLSVVVSAQTTRQPMLIDDAVQNPRFAADSYFQGLKVCSLLVVPIWWQDQPEAVLILENRVQPGFFDFESLESVLLIAGQLAISLDNARSYASLEREVTARTADLDHSLAMIKATLEATNDGILAVDIQMKVTFWNERFQEMWGVSSEILELRMDGPLRRAVLDQLKDPAAFESGILRIYANPSAEAFDLLEFKDGRVFERFCRPQIVSEEIVGRVWSFRDITERRRSEDDLRELHSQLLSASRASGMAEIATNILHNVGNVLNSVNVSATLLQETTRESRVLALEKLAALMQTRSHDLPKYLSEDPQGKLVPTYLLQLSQHLTEERQKSLEELTSLLESIDHIRKIVTMQQTYARAPGIVQEVDVVQLMESSLRLNDGALSREGVEVVRDFEQLPMVYLDKHRVLQVLTNLISNAKHACLDATSSPKVIKLSVHLREELICFSVEDNGVGIPPENLDRIFRHGFTTRAKGYGFGLHSGALSADAMGGSLNVYSDGVGKGAKFSLIVPFHPQAPLS